MFATKGWGRRAIRGWLVLVVWTVVGSAWVGTACAASLDASLLPRIQGATFEVVAAKPDKDPLTYEKPLPLELLDYQDRTDKYFSIGTAFAIGKNRYVTAGHVLMAGLDSLWGQPSLRDAKGNVYAIDKIEKFDLRRDLVVFSLVKDPAPEPLEINTSPVMNQEVYAVGNALGTGVVIRDGLYTSDTPEQEQGQWKWMRFSAAASPGNSGGPLLDKDGKVIGVVLMKSANENLNYALQMKEVLDAPEKNAVIDSRLSYRLDIFDTTLSNSFKGTFPLPQTLPDFFASYTKLFNAYVETQLKDILAKDADRVFPRGEGSDRLLYNEVWSNMLPRMIVRSNTGEWFLQSNTTKRQSLSNNGYLDVSLAQSKFVMHLRRPDNTPVANFYTDPVVLGDLLAKSGLFARTVGPEHVRITSLGKPISDTVHVDGWKRRWQVRTWTLPYDDTKIIVYCLPLPDGYAMSMVFASAGGAYDSAADLRAITDFMTVEYDGSLAQWAEFLKNTSLLPDAIKDVHLDVTYQKSLSLRTPRFNVAFTPDLLGIEPDSQLSMPLGMLPDHGKVIWGPVGLHYNPRRSESNYLVIYRNVKPPASLDESYASYWDKLINRRHPYESQAYAADGNTKIAAPKLAGDVGKDTVVYTAFFTMGGTQPQDKMKTQLDLLLKGLQVNEH